MQPFLNKFKALSVARPSMRPTTTDSSHIDPSLFHDNNSTPSTTSTQRSSQPLVTNVIVKHSSAFNSSRSAGMNKLRQLQFIEAMKGMIINTAHLTYPQPTYPNFKVIISRKDKVCLASPNEICDAAMHVASLLAVTDQSNVVLDESEEFEYVADAVEYLWEKMMGQVGNVLEGLRRGGGGSSEGSTSSDGGVSSGGSSSRDTSVLTGGSISSNGELVQMVDTAERYVIGE